MHNKSSQNQVGQELPGVGQELPPEPITLLNQSMNLKTLCSNMSEQSVKKLLTVTKKPTRHSRKYSGVQACGKPGRKTQLQHSEHSSGNGVKLPGTASEFATILAEDIACRNGKHFGFDRLLPSSYLNGQRWNDEKPETIQPQSKPSSAITVSKTGYVFFDR